jgi:hypothetical protein
MNGTVDFGLCYAPRECYYQRLADLRAEGGLTNSGEYAARR